MTRRQAPARADGLRPLINTGETLPTAPARRRRDAGERSARAGDRRRPPSEHPEQPTELWLMRRFLAAHGSDVARVGERWRAWDGRRWEAGELAAPRVRLLMEATVRALSEDLERSDGDERAALARFARRAESATVIRHALELAEPHVSRRADEFDADPGLVTVDNGTICLSTGELRPHRREDLITHLVPHQYDPNASAPRWGRFLREVTCGRDGLETFLRHWAGYCLTGHVREHALVLAVGAGANGKSTFVEALTHTFGTDLAEAAPPGLLLADRNGRHPTEIWALRARRLVVANELPSNATFAEERLKWLTGGDVLSARAMRSDFASFRPSHKLIVAANDMPRVRDTSEGFWRRLRVVPFDASFRERPDPRLGDTLAAEAPGILAWAVVGAMEWFEAGLGAPVVVRDATAGYRATEDVVGRWLDDRDARGLTGGLAADLQRELAAWAESHGEKGLSGKALAKELERRGWTKQRTERGAVWSPPAQSLGNRLTDDGC